MEREVYRRVALLFKDEPDLLQEFSQFLPDARASPPGTSGVNILCYDNNIWGECYL